MDADIKHAKIKFTKVFGKENEHLIENKTKDFILTVIDYGLLGLDIEWSIKYTEKYGFIGVDVMRSFNLEEESYD